MRFISSFLPVGFLLAGLFAWAPAAGAHAILVDSKPAVQGHVQAGTVPVVFRYNSRVDARRSRLLLIGTDKSQTVLPILPDAPEDQITAQVDLPPGQYTIRWQVLAVDGHITRGDVPFTVTAPPVTASTVTAPTVTLP